MPTTTSSTSTVASSETPSFRKGLVLATNDNQFDGGAIAKILAGVAVIVVGICLIVVIRAGRRRYRYGQPLGTVLRNDVLESEKPELYEVHLDRGGQLMDGSDVGKKWMGKWEQIMVSDLPPKHNF